MNSTKRNVGVLAACQAMLFTNNTTLIAINGLAGLALAPHRGLATLPVTCWILGGALATMPASLHMKRVGRQAGLTSGIFWGLAGGLVGGVIGPNLSRFTVDLLPTKFMGAYLVLIVFAIAALVLLRFISIPNPTAAEQAAKGRPLSEIAAQPRFIVAVLSGALGYGVMNFLMTSTPIAMGVCGHPYSDAAFVISSHVIGMFAPSFFTGALIRRFGVITVMLTGALLNLACIG